MIVRFPNPLAPGSDIQIHVSLGTQLIIRSFLDALASLDFKLSVSQSDIRLSSYFFLMKITDLNANPSDPNAKMTVVGQDCRETDPNIAWLSPLP